jgi:hypothetical protein
MVTYAIRTDNSPLVEKWLSQLKNRSSDANFLKNPFSISFKKFKSLTVFCVKPMYPNFSWMGWLSGLGILLVFGQTYWLIPCVVIGTLGIAWTPEFYFMVTKRGLRKIGYTGKVERVKLGVFIEEVLL